MDDALAAIVRRYDFHPPELWQSMVAHGHLDCHHADHLQFTDLVWLAPEQIANYRFAATSIDGLIPFAETLNHDTWCWYPGIDRSVVTPVVYCPDEDEVAVIYAPDFASFLYRLLLEELTHTFLVERSNTTIAREQLHSYITILSGLLPEAWMTELAAVRERPLRATEVNFYGMLSEDEARTLLEKHVPYARLDEEFEHFLEP